MAIQTVTSKDATHIYFARTNDDWFHFNQRSASFTGTVHCIKELVRRATRCRCRTRSDATSRRPASSGADDHLLRGQHDDAGHAAADARVNHFTPQALAGVVEDLDLTYDLVDRVNNPTNITSLPYTDAATGVTYTSNQIKKVNIHVGVRSESMSKPAQDYVRNHISTAVDVRSLASVDRYDTRNSADTNVKRAIMRQSNERGIAMITTLLVLMLISALLVGFTDGRHERPAVPVHRSRPRPGVLRRQRRDGEAHRRPRQPVLLERGADQRAGDGPDGDRSRRSPASRSRRPTRRRRWRRASCPPFYCGVAEDDARPSGTTGYTIMFCADARSNPTYGDVAATIKTGAVRRPDGAEDAVSAGRDGEDRRPAAKCTWSGRSKPSRSRSSSSGCSRTSTWRSSPVRTSASAAACTPTATCSCAGRRRDADAERQGDGGQGSRPAAARERRARSTTARRTTGPSTWRRRRRPTWRSLRTEGSVVDGLGSALNEPTGTRRRSAPTTATSATAARARRR